MLFNLLFFVFILSVSSFPSDHSGQISTAVLTPFNNVGDITNGKIQQAIRSKTITFTPQFPDSGRKYAVLEQESLDSKKETAYGRLHELVALISKPQPIIDNISEHEKYGNDGGKNRAISTAIIAGYEGFANLLNAAVDAPFTIGTEIGRKITTSGNSLGNKLVGLS